MVDNATLMQGMTDDMSLLSPEGMKELTHEQRVEVTKFLVEKITTSDELLGAVTRKVKELRSQESEGKGKC